MNNQSILEIVIKARDEASAKLNGLQGNLKNMEGSFTSMRNVGAAAFAGIGAGIGLAIKQAADMEQIEVAFTTILKSGEKAKNMVNDLNIFAAQTPYQFEEIAQASKSLLAFGVPAEQMKSELQAIGDISSGIGANIGEIAEIYGKAKVQGRLYAEDINQLTGRGIPIIGALAKQFGVTEGEVKKLVESGKIGFPQLQKAFKDLTQDGGQFEGMMKAQSETMSGLFSTLKDNISLTVTAVGKQFLPALKEIMTTIMPLLESIRQWVSENPKLTSTILLAALAIAGIVTAIGFLGLVLPSIIAGLGFLGSAISAVGVVLAFVTSPIGLVVIAIAALVAAIVWCVYNWDTVKAKVIEVWEIIKAYTANAVEAISSRIKAWVSNVYSSVVGVFTLVKNEVVGIWEAIKSSIFGVIDSIMSKIQAMVDAVRNAYSAASSFVGNGISSVSSLFGGKRANGGPVSVGNSYLVGENGPELFTPNSTGAVIPNNGLGGNITLNITGNNFLGDDDVADKIGAAIMRSLQFQLKF